MFTFNRKDGLYSIQKNTQEQCRLIVKFAPILLRYYPLNADLQVALQAALVACQALEQLVEEQRQSGV